MRVPVIAIGLAASVALGSGAAVAQNSLQQSAMERRVQTLLASAPAARCEPVAFKIYFEKNRAELTRPARTTLDLVSGQIKGCTIRAVRIGAEPDDVETPAGRRLAGQRGAAVLDALNARGVAPDEVVIAQNGQAGEPASAAPDHLEIAIAPAAPKPDPSSEPYSVARNEV